MILISNDVIHLIGTPLSFSQAGKRDQYTVKNGLNMSNNYI